MNDFSRFKCQDVFFYSYLYPVSSLGVWYDEPILSRSLFFLKKKIQYDSSMNKIYTK